VTGKDRAARFGTVATRRVAAAPTPSSVVRKFTILLDLDVSEAFDADLSKVRRAADRAVNKSDVVRELLAALHEDPSLLRLVADRLRTSAR